MPSPAVKVEAYTQTAENHSAMSRTRALSEIESRRKVAVDTHRAHCIGKLRSHIIGRDHLVTFVWPRSPLHPLLLLPPLEAKGVEHDESLAMTLAAPTPPPPPSPTVYRIDMPDGARIYEAKEPPSRPLDNSRWLAEAGKRLGMTVRATAAKLGLRGRGTAHMPDGGGDAFQRGKLIIHVIGAAEVEVSRTTS